MDFSYVHFYRVPSIEVEKAMAGVLEIFPGCKIDAREPIVLPTEQAQISEITQPFHTQPNVHKDFDLYGQRVKLYDGFELQQVFAQTIPEKERSLDHLHVIFTDLLACTFSEDDGRYHARTVVCGTPSLISVPGIVEAPAKPREFYFNLSLGMDAETAKKNVASRFLDYDDDRIAAATNFALQAIFFFLTGGEPFCNNPTCRLFNAHWQEDLLKTLKNPMLCTEHQKIADKFNRRLARM